MTHQDNFPAGPIKRRQSMHRQLRQSEYRISLMNEQIEAAQKLASLGTMACLIAHEFNNILVPIINYAELALQNAEDLPLSQKALAKAVKHGNRAKTIIDSMLGMATDQRQKWEKVRLAGLVEECFHCVARDFAKDGITVVVDIQPEMELYAVPGQLQQVLLNLIINARQALVDHGGKLSIRASDDGEGFVKITVADTGCGIEAGLIEKIFEPFVSTKTLADRPDRRGAGLGLSVCKGIIEAHQGNIEVASKPGEGTTFTVTLPKDQTSLKTDGGKAEKDVQLQGAQSNPEAK